MHFWMIGPLALKRPIAASERKQLAQPFSVLRMISLHSVVKLLGRVNGVPSGWVMINATPVAAEKLSWMRCISSSTNRSSSAISAPSRGCVRATTRFEMTSYACLRSLMSRRKTWSSPAFPDR